MIRFTRPNSRSPVEDDDTRVEIRMGKRWGPGRWWEARWRPEQRLAPGDEVGVEFLRWRESATCTVT